MDNVTKYSKNIFTQYLHVKGLDLDTVINNNKLDSTLKNFYVAARTKKGEHYKSTSLIAIRQGLARFINNLHHDVDIINGENVTGSSEVFKAIQKRKRRCFS